MDYHAELKLVGRNLDTFQRVCDLEFDPAQKTPIFIRKYQGFCDRSDANIPVYSLTETREAFLHSEEL
jgi:hypothetical protein